MPDVPVDLDSFADSFDWVCCTKDLEHYAKVTDDLLVGRVSNRAATTVTTTTLLRRVYQSVLWHIPSKQGYKA